MDSEPFGRGVRPEKDRTISIEEIIDILDQFEQNVIAAIELNKAIDADNYENVGQYKLIQRIKKQIRKELKVSPPIF